MAEFLPYLVVAAALAAVMGLLTWVARLTRRRGGVGSGVAGALAAYQEAYRVTAYESHHEIRAQAERRVPVLSPDHLWTPDRGGGGPYGEGERTRRARPARPRRSLRRRVSRLRRGR